MLAKTEQEFVEKKIRLITISHVGDQIVFSGQRSVGRILRVQATMDLLINLMRDKVGETGENQSFEHLTTKKVDSATAEGEENQAELGLLV